MKTISQYQRRQMEAALKAEIRRYQKSLPLMASLDVEIYAAGRELFANDAGLALWLCDPARALGWKIPLLVARTKSGRKQVINILMALVHGVFL